MKLTHACILVGRMEPMLSLFAAEAHEELAPGSAKPTANRSIELEFLVEAVAAEYERLRQIPGIGWVTPRPPSRGEVGLSTSAIQRAT
ncbi:MAG TPA: hypothetical protein ENN53_01630 [Candidatus Acetothermia bacterium]|nr:hypothetical protein [Candidatus Acetothermia bacterium]